jgi:hypothetical protein
MQDRTLSPVLVIQNSFSAKKDKFMEDRITEGDGVVVVLDESSDSVIGEVVYVPRSVGDFWVIKTGSRLVYLNSISQHIISVSKSIKEN